jgi:flagellar motility protein MotE (MotC chaperone)
MQPFFIICVVSGVAFSLLAVLLATRRVPVHPPASAPQTAPAVAQRIQTNDASHKLVNQLMPDVQQARATMLKRAADLRSREESLRLQQEILPMLKSDMQQLQNKLEEAIVRTTPTEQANLKRLAEVYGKMAPDSVATLLSKLETAQAAAILRLLSERQAAAVLAAAVATGSNGVIRAAAWSDSIRRMASEQGNLP